MSISNVLKNLNTVFKTDLLKCESMFDTLNKNYVTELAYFAQSTSEILQNDALYLSSAGLNIVNLLQYGRLLQASDLSSIQVSELVM